MPWSTAAPLNTETVTELTISKPGDNNTKNYTTRQIKGKKGAGWGERERERERERKHDLKIRTNSAKPACHASG